MDSLLIYLLKSSLSLAFFYILYILSFRNDTFFRLRRFYLLFAIAFSLIFPIFTFQLSSAEIAQLSIYFSDAIFITPDNEVNSLEQSVQSFGWKESSSLIIFIVTITLFVRFIGQVYSLYKLKKNNESDYLGSYTLIKIEDSKASSFSFFKWIFLHIGEKSHEDILEILEHEKVHVNQNHSVDTVLCEVLCMIFWWNPFAWLIRKEIKTNLEYLADRGVLEEGFNPRNYQYILLQITTQHTGIPIINYFNVSELKKRIIMMNKKKTSIIVSVKYFLALPLALGLLLTNCSLDNQSEKEQELDNPSETVKYIIVHDKEDIEVVTSDENRKPYVTVEKMPSYPGGEKAFREFISDNLKYPVTAQDAGIQGRVTIRFVVSRDGEVKDANVLRGLDPACDKEAIRVIQKMPRWTPGEQNGEKVDVYFTVPIVFKLQ